MMSDSYVQYTGNSADPACPGALWRCPDRELTFDREPAAVRQSGVATGVWQGLPAYWLGPCGGRAERIPAVRDVPPRGMLLRNTLALIGYDLLPGPQEPQDDTSGTG